MLTVWRRVLIVLLWLAVPLQGALAQGVCCGADAEADHDAAVHSSADSVDAARHLAAHAAHADAHADHAHAQPEPTHPESAAPVGDLPDAAEAGLPPHAHTSAAGCAHCAACCAAAALAPPGPLALLLDVDDSPDADVTVRLHGILPTRLERPPRAARA